VPTSRKRVKKPKTEVQANKKTANIVKSKIGKTVIVVLSLGFVLSLIVGLVYVIYQAWVA